MRIRNFLPRIAELERLRAKGWQVLTYKTCSLVLAWHTYDGPAGARVEAKAWRGKAEKPAWFYTFADLRRAEMYAGKYEAELIASEAFRGGRTEERKARRATLKASDHWTVGDALYNSWGYDQTNIDWYQVVEVLPRSIRIRAIMGNNNMGMATGGQSQPVRGHFAGEPMLKPLDDQGHVSFEFGCGTKWDGKAKYCSNYA